MNSISIEQVRILRWDNGPPALDGRSPGFEDSWRPLAERVVVGFGIRPPGQTCPEALFAQPFGDDRVAVVQVTDYPNGQMDNLPKGLAFHFWIMLRSEYEQFLGDPFALARLLQAQPHSSGSSLPTLSLPREPLPPRTVAQVQNVLKRVKAFALAEDQDPEDPSFERTPQNSESPALLGGVQALVDGGRLVFERPAPDADLIEGLWTLLPYRTRAKLWPATFAFSNALGFDALVVPRIYAADFEGYTSEEQAAEYPPGRYEMSLQIAAEQGDQRELDALLNRRTVQDTFRLAWALLIVVVLLALTPRLLEWFTPTPAPALTLQHYKSAAAAGMVAAGDPWTAVGLKLHGDSLGFKR
ncbi:MAG: hypothetical protein L0Y72_29630 [Gemmataceae bacterium]|nr:hypothetical protein [Gemmataceae bacterium]MCI0743208.1 hypothetical protein [Gemmataceae bacterium]